jgi:hypothetical protein
MMCKWGAEHSRRVHNRGKANAVTSLAA